MSTLKVDTIATRTGSGNITVSNNIAGAGTISGTNITASGTLGVTGNTTVGGTLVNTGLITASAGVAIGGTGAANTLDDYEEGDWTPTFHTGFSSISGYTYNAGHYVKIGCIVYTDFYIYFSGTGNSAQVAVAGLPFNLSNQQSSGAALTRGGGTSSYNSITNVVTQFYGAANTDRFSLYKSGNTGVTVSGTLTNQYLIGTFIYKTDA